MAITRKIKNNGHWRGCGEIGTIVQLLVGVKNVQSLWKTAWKSFKKINIELPYDPEILLLCEAK